jgi:hypothetical protein
MEYIDLETDIEIRFESERLDILQLGYLNLGMHRIMNRIALDMLTEEGWLTGSLPTDLGGELVLVRGIAVSFENGSFVQKIKLKVASVISRENLQRFGRDFVISVMANIAASGIMPVPPKLPPDPPPVVQQAKPDINKMVQDLASNGGGKVTIRSYQNNQVDSEVTIEIPNHERRSL